jgi:DNA-binding NarL/FixJ family response regulator
MGELASVRRKLAEAAALFAESLVRYHEFGDAPYVLKMVERLERVARDQGDDRCEAALRASRDALQRNSANVRRLAHCLAEWARSIAAQRDSACAARLQTAAVKLRSGAGPSPHDAPAVVAAQPAGSVIASLTEREREVAALVARGLTNREVATDLGMSERTAEAHVGRILAKLGVATRRQVAAWASGPG